MSFNSVVFVLGKGRDTRTSRKAWRQGSNCKFVCNICLEFKMLVVRLESSKWIDVYKRLVKSSSGLAGNDEQTSLLADSELRSEDFSDRTVNNVVPCMIKAFSYIKDSSDHHISIFLILL